MKVIILAAGMGKRLGDQAVGKPKCLLEIGGLSLLQRHFQIFESYGLNDISIVTGYRPEAINEAISRAPSPLSIDTYHNPDFTEGSVVSLHCAGEVMDSGTEILLMDADVLYDHLMIKTLLETEHENCFLLDEDFVPGEEPVKLCVKDNIIIEFRKKIPQELKYDLRGESVGFFRFSAEMAGLIAERSRHYAETDKRDWPHEEAIREILLAHPNKFNYENVSDLAWIEIDFPEDIERAKNEILKKMHHVR